MLARRPLVRLAVAGLVAGLIAVLAAATVPAAAPRPTLLRLDGIGPLKLGMTRSAAVATGWLADRGRGCPLGAEVPVTYRLSGDAAPDGLRGSAEFTDDRLDTLVVTRGARTAVGVRPFHTTIKAMVDRYRKAGDAASAKYERLFGGTFVTVRRRGRVVLGGFGRARLVTALALPGIPVCE
jgi:hypothetical protein